jgi:hypothetical protein
VCVRLHLVRVHTPHFAYVRGGWLQGELHHLKQTHTPAEIHEGQFG